MKSILTLVISASLLLAACNKSDTDPTTDQYPSLENTDWVYQNTIGFMEVSFYKKPGGNLLVMSLPDSTERVHEPTTWRQSKEQVFVTYTSGGITHVDSGTYKSGELILNGGKFTRQ